MNALLMNLILATVWLLLNQDPGVFDFFIGFILGFLLILLFSKMIQAERYIRRTVSFIVFLFYFLWQFIKANLNVAYIILFVPKSSLSPGYFDYDIRDFNWGETILLSYCITLTPGTITVKIDTEKKILVIHALDCKNTQEIKDELDTGFKKAILRFTR